MSDPKTKCWWCRKPLAPDRKSGGYYFETVTDPEGHEHPVHKICKPDVRFNTFEPTLPDSVRKPVYD